MRSYKLLTIATITVVLGACSTAKTTRPVLAPMPSDEWRVQTQPIPSPEPFELEPMEPAITNVWSNITDTRAVSSRTKPRLVVECFRDESSPFGKIVVRHDDNATTKLSTSVSKFQIGQSTITGMGDRYNNIYMDYNDIDNIVERMYQVSEDSVVTVTTDYGKPQQVSMTGFRSAAIRTFADCQY